MPDDGLEHGVRRSYQLCRQRPEGSCEACRKAESSYMRDYRLRTVKSVLREKREQLQDTARERARKRLAKRHAQEYYRLLTQERKKLGLI